MTYLWAQIRSYHLTPETLPPVEEQRVGFIKTLCGRWAPNAPRYESIRTGEKTCESCFRIREGRS